MEENGLFITGSMNEEELRRVFSSCGKIRNVSVFGGYGFVYI